MKLVDILARELRSWPKGFGKKVGQCHHGAIHSFANPHTQSGQKFTRCDNYMRETVTRTEWQAAVDALKAESAPAWVGIGLPPVGTVCEAKTTRGWSRGTIIAHGLPPKENIAVWQEDGERISLGVKEYFRQIRTPEQIAAEERDKAIEGMIADTNILTGIMSDRRIMAGQLYDAGYRKFKIVDN